MARPKKQIDRTQFEKLCALQCTLNEMAGFFECSNKTLERWCNDEYKKPFSEIFDEKRTLGKIALRRIQWRLAEKSPQMAIFLGKNYLGQKDHVQADITASAELDPISQALKELAELKQMT